MPLPKVHARSTKIVSPPQAVTVDNYIIYTHTYALRLNNLFICTYVPIHNELCGIIGVQ